MTTGIQRLDASYKNPAETGERTAAWRAWGRDSRGKRISKLCRTEAEAKTWRDQNTHQKVTGQLPDTKAGKQSLGALWADQEASEEYAPATLAIRGEVWKVVGPKLGAKAIAEIDRATIAAFLKGIDKPGMRDKVRSVLSGVFGYAVRDGRLVNNPAQRQGQRHSTRAARMRGSDGNGSAAKKYLTSDELTALLDNLPERYRMLVELMARMGLRPGEAYALTVGKYDTMRRLLTIDTSVTGFTKTGEARTLPVPKIVGEHLVEHLAAFTNPKDPSALMFPADLGGQINPNNFRSRTFEDARVAAKIKEKLTPNSCRHTAASFAISSGASVYAVQRMLGHAKASTTLDIYGELWSDDLERLLAGQLDKKIRAEAG